MRFFHKKEVPVPTVQGLFLILLAFGILFAGLGAGLYPFLAQNRPQAEATLAIVEGWIDDADLVAVVDRLPSGTVYIATGGPIEFGADLFRERTYAELTAVRLQKLGVESRFILEAPAPYTSVDRTYISALAVCDRLKEAGLFGQPANIYTVGSHGRRSYLLYRFAFGSDAPLGIVSLESSKSDLRHWWRSSMAFKNICTEVFSLSYTYCTWWKYD